MVYQDGGTSKVYGNAMEKCNVSILRTVHTMTLLMSSHLPCRYLTIVMASLLPGTLKSQEGRLHLTLYCRSWSMLVSPVLSSTSASALFPCQAVAWE